MKSICTTFAIIASIEATKPVDPCTHLCQVEGPTICTGGSWTKGDSICHAYFHTETGHCYHSAATRETCPGSGKPVRAHEVDAIVARIEAASVPKHLRASTTTQPTTEEVSTTTEQFIGTTEGTAVSTEAARDTTEEITYTTEGAIVPELKSLPDDLGGMSLIALDKPRFELAKLLMQVFLMESSWKTITLYKPVFDAIANAAWSISGMVRADPVKHFKQLSGDLLFDYASRSAAREHDMLRNALTLAFLIPVKEEDKQRFVQESGLRKFCRDNAPHIRKMFLLHHVKFGERTKIPNMVESLKETHVGQFLLSYCPEIIEKYPEIAPVVMAERMYRTISGMSYTLQGINAYSLDTKDVPVERAFSHTIDDIQARDPRSLRMTVSRLRMAGMENSQINIPTYFSAAGSEIFKTPESIYFKAHSEKEGMVEISPEGPRGHYEAIGRFLAMSVLHGYPMGIELPASYLSGLLGQVPQVHEELSAEVQERLELMSTGFRAVIESDKVADLVNVESLGRLIKGTPITVEDLIENAVFSGDFGEATDNGRQTKWVKQYWRSLSKEDFKKMIKLLTGRSVFPAGGLKNLQPSVKVVFTLIRADQINPLPRIEPVVDAILVPLYETQAQLVEMFDLALTMWRLQ